MLFAGILSQLFTFLADFGFVFHGFGFTNSLIFIENAVVFEFFVFFNFDVVWVFWWRFGLTLGPLGLVLTAS